MHIDKFFKKLFDSYNSNSFSVLTISICWSFSLWVSVHYICFRRVWIHRVLGFIDVWIIGQIYFCPMKTIVVNNIEITFYKHPSLYRNSHKHVWSKLSNLFENWILFINYISYPASLNWPRSIHWIFYRSLVYYNANLSIN